MEKLFLITFFITFLAMPVHADLSLSQIQENLQKQSANRRSENILNLRLSKNYLIAGNIQLAKYFLEQMNIESTELTLIRKRYLAIIQFIEGRYQESLKTIDDPQLSQLKYDSQLCLLRILNKLPFKTSKITQADFQECQDLTEGYSANGQFWLQSMKDFLFPTRAALLRSRDTNSLNLDDYEILSLWLKKAIYSNNEKYIIDNIEVIPGHAYRSKKIRELIGLIYYRIGDKKKAFDFIEDIESPNAENIKGNIRLGDQEYELAFGHFKLALKRKENSFNALERSLPLAWTLQQWKDGESLLKRVIDKNFDKRKSMALEAAFLIRQKKYQIAAKVLKELVILFKDEPPREVNLMLNYVALQTDDKDLYEKTVSKNCKRFDGVNCWLQGQEFLWGDFAPVMKRKDSLTNNFNIDSWKIKQKVSPLKEEIYIDQRDIEELDDRQVRKDFNQRLNQP